jgi:bla regulator protein BlaR1
VETLLHVGLSNALLATLLALLAALVGRCCRRPAVRHGLWLLVLLKLVTPPLLPLDLPWPAAPAPAAEPVVAATLIPAEVDAVSAEEEGGAAEMLSLPAPPTPVAPAAVSGEMVVGAVWLTGSLLWLAVAALRVARFQHLLRHARPAPAALQEQAEHLAQRLGLARCPGVWFVPAPVSPLLWALGRTPRLLLPEALWEELTESQRATLLLHELAHLRRGDHWVRRLELVTLGLYWWHPVVWWAGRQLREAEELCCDAWVVWALPDETEAYARALVETVTFLSQTRPPLPVGASGVGRVPLLKRRLTMILGGNTPRGPGWLGFLLLIGLGLLLLPLVCSWSQQPLAPPASVAVAEAPPDKDVAPDPLTEAVWREKVAAVRFDREQRKKAEEEQRAAQLEQIRDEVELLEAQLRVKEADLKAAKAGLQLAQQSYASLKPLGQQGTVTQEAVVKAQGEVTKAEAEIIIKEASLQEPLVRLKQAQRRLKALEQAHAKTDVDFAPEKLFPQRSWDFGNVLHHNIVAHRWRLTNTTDKTVHIGALRVTSGCATAKVDQQELKPNEWTEMEVTLDGRRFVGPKTFNVYVLFDRPAPAEVVLEFKANGVAADETPPADDRKRLEQLEKKLDLLLDELNSLRREMKPKKPAGAAPEEPLPRGGN